MNLLCVFIGGGCGAAARWLLGLLPVAGGFPYVTCGINLLGSFLIGLISGFVAAGTNFDQRLILLLQIGFCGGFTTFSTFSLDLFKMLDQGRIGLALLYAVGTVVGCLLATWFGRRLTAAA